MNTGSALARFTITLSQAVTEPVQVEWFTSDGTAKAGVDYAANKGTVIFAPGETAKTVDILVYGRAVGSEDRTFFVEMLPPTNAILGASIGECIITVDTSGSTPVTAIIVPTGPKGDKGDPGEDGISPDPAEIAVEVAPLIDVGSTVLTAQGTETLGHPDATTVKAVARRVAYSSPALIATLTLASGDNTISPSDLTGDTVDFYGAGFVPLILHAGSFTEANWRTNEDGTATIIGATAGDVLYAVQYHFVSAFNSRKSILDASDVMFEAALYWKNKSFEKGFELKTSRDALKWEAAPPGTGPYFIWGGTFPKSVPLGSTPASTGGISSTAWIDVGDAMLRTQLGRVDGQKYVGRCPDIATLRLTEPTVSKQLINVHEYTAGTSVGGGFFWYDSGDTTTADNGVDVFVTTGGKRWKRCGERFTLIDAGGVPGTDSSVALQRLINRMKGKAVIIPPGDFTVAGVVLNDSSFNNTHFVCDGVLKLKQRASTSENNAGVPAFVGILFKDVFNISGNLRWDGQRTIQPSEEHIYTIGIAGGGNIRLDVQIREIKGDGLYISQSDWLSNSATPYDIFITGTIENTAVDGRNAISVISCKNPNIMVSLKNIGGIVGGSQQPGGIDFEPNYDYQKCTGGVIEFTAENCGYGLCIFGKSYNVELLKVKATLINSSPYLSRGKTCTIDVSVDSAVNAGNLDTFLNSTINVTHNNCSNGFDVGWRGEIENCKVTVVGESWSNYVARTGKIKRGQLRWEARNCLPGGTGIALRVDTPQDGLAYQMVGVGFSCDVHYDGVVQYASRNAGGLITFSQCYWNNSNLSGWSNFGAAVTGQLANNRYDIECGSFSQAGSQPGVGFYCAGDFVKNATPTVSGGKVLQGWRRLTTGTGHVANTDWAASYTTTS